MLRSTLFRMLTLVGNNLVSHLAQHPLLASEPRVPKRRNGSLRLRSKLEPAEDASRGGSGESTRWGIRIPAVSSVCARAVVRKAWFWTGSGHMAWKVGETCKFSDLLRHSGGPPLPSQARPRHTAVCRGLMAAKQAARHRSTSTRVCLTLKFVLLTLSFKF